MTLHFDEDAARIIQQIFDDESQEQLAQRIDEMLELLETDPNDVRLHRRRMHDPKYWLVMIFGSGRDFALMWDFVYDEPWIHWAGDF